MAEDRIDIKYFTDPLCCWSWALEPQWRKFIFQFRDHVSWQYVLGGLIPSWNGFVDNINSVCRPAQMGPLWMHAQQLSGMPMGHRIWIENPPSSSFPPCVAIKSAALQSSLYGEYLLRRLREFCHLKEKNICDTTLICEAAVDLATKYPSFQLKKFLEDFQGQNGQDSFREDWQETKRSDIGRFPTLILKKNSTAIQISGYRPFDVLRKALYYLDPSLQQIPLNTDIAQYRQFWGSLLPREEAEFFSKTAVQA